MNKVDDNPSRAEVSVVEGSLAERCFVVRYHRDDELTGVLGMEHAQAGPPAPPGHHPALSRNRRNISARCSLNRPDAESSSNPSIDSALASRAVIVLWWRCNAAAA